MMKKLCHALAPVLGLVSGFHGRSLGVGSLICLDDALDHPARLLGAAIFLGTFANATSVFLAGGLGSRLCP